MKKKKVIKKDGVIKATFGVHEFIPVLLVEEDFKKLGVRLSEAMKKTEQDKGKTMRVVLDIPVEVGALATWFDYRLESYHKLVEPFPTDIDIPPVEVHRKRAKRHLQRVLCSWFRENYNLLDDGIHPLLNEKPTKGG